MKWSFLLLLAIGAACTMAMPIMELSSEDAGAEMIQVEEQPKVMAPADKKQPKVAAPKKVVPQAPEEKKKAPVVPKKSDKPHAGHSEVHKPHGAPKAEEPKHATPKEAKPKKAAPAAPKKAAPAVPAVPKKAVPQAPGQVGKVAAQRKAAPTKHMKKAAGKHLEAGSPAAAKAALMKEAMKAAGVTKLGESTAATEAPVPKMPCGHPFAPCNQHSKAANPQDPYDEGNTMTPALKAHLVDEDAIAKQGKGHGNPINTFATPEAKLKTSEDIAKRIFDIANAEVSSKNQKTESKTAIGNMKKAFSKSVEVVRSLIESAKDENKDENKEQGGEEGGEEGDEQGGKGGIAQQEAMEGPLQEEDDKLIKSLPEQPTKEAEAEVMKAAKAHMKP